VTVGLPMPPGACRDERAVSLLGPAGPVVPDAHALERWPDGSIRWLLLNFRADAPASYRLVAEGTDAPAAVSSGRPISWRDDAAGFRVDTGRCVFEIPSHGPIAIHATAEGHAFGARAEVACTDSDGDAVLTRVTAVDCEREGTVRLIVRVTGVIGGGRRPLLHVVLRLHFDANCATVQCDLTVTNPRSAAHPGGCWELGDGGSVLLRDLSLRIVPDRVFDEVWCSPEPGVAPTRVTDGFELYQDSSGGERWDSEVHLNRHGVVPARFRGYRLYGPSIDWTGLRATPAVWGDGGSGRIAVALKHFWQNCPKAITGGPEGLTLGLFPGQYGDLHEIQGGEQKTHVVHLCFGQDAVAASPLDWVRQPVFAAASPEWYAFAHALPYLTPAAEDPSDGYKRLVSAAIEGPDSFTRKREAIDEYGWRHFGDLHADHEAALQDPSQPIVSHYNNQYDAIAGFACQFLRTGDVRWHTAMDELAAHVADIDLYHTEQDKAAYNGGLFWHTCHYQHAGLSTHRSYPRAPGIAGGGPSDEHAYSTGLMLHYLLTGRDASREAVRGLADWVMHMDDGRLTVFRWLSTNRTGLASATASPGYHGPGRGGGNAIVVLLNGFRVTGNRAYLLKAEELIRRCIHPDDDVAGRDLLDAERKWSYTVFLQALGRYLDDKLVLGELDAAYAYARASLLHYARWMADHEYPYLDKPEILEFPTETWAAQDMRKSDVFNSAARYAAPPERGRFLACAQYFFDSCVNYLSNSPTRTLTRPVVILLTCGAMHAASRRMADRPEAPAGPSGLDFGRPEPFIPQKVVAIRRAKTVVMTTAAAVTLFISLLLAGCRS
jgi:hypothetical protein